MSEWIFPKAIFEITGAYQAEENLIGCSGARTFRVDAENGSFYLKTMPVHIGRTLKPEKDRLDWLKGKLPVPDVLSFTVEKETEYMLLSLVKGHHAADEIFHDPERKRRITKLLADGLKKIHNLKVKDCPFDQTVSRQIERARYQITLGQVDVDDFDEKRKGRKVEELFDELLHTLPDHEDIVFTHGDYCLPNIIINDQGISGFIDWGKGGYADRYQDLAIAARSITYNLGFEYVPIFLKEYGMDHVDEAKMEFFQFMDEFF